MGNKAEPCPSPMLMSKKEEIKLFQIYLVFLPTN